MAKGAEGAAGAEVDGDHLIHKGYRKINRILGLVSPIPLLAPVTAALAPAIAQINASSSAVFDGTIGQKDPVRVASVAVLDNVIAAPTAETAEQASYLGPLDYWSNVYTPSAVVTTRLKSLRLRMLQRDRIAIVAHRAMGATNRSFGGLIADADPARDRPVENSPGAFNLALGEAASAAKPGGIDGVECDVFLSSDGVAMLSHDNNIAEQMSVARRAAYNPAALGARIQDRTAADLTALPRRDLAPVAGAAVPAPAAADPTSVFMTLDQLLTAAGGVAGAYHALTGKPFRVEIEMKGHNVGVHDIIDITAKTISQFKKRVPAQAANLEIVMFNGTPGDVAKHAEKRSTKSRLGNLTVALGGRPAAAPDPEIDEYRSSLSRPDEVRVADPAAAPDFISTYVLGAEKKLLDNVDPTLLDWSSRGLDDVVLSIIRDNVAAAGDEHAVWLANEANLRAQQPAGQNLPTFRSNFKYAMRVEMGRHRHATHLLAQQQLSLANPRFTHVLTDFPERAADTRLRLVQP